MAQNPTQKKTAGAFDIRNVIGALLGVYGIVLILVYVFGGNSAQGNKDDNLWTGLVMLVVGIVFLAWGWLRPVVVKEAPAKDVRGTPGERRTPPKAG